MIFRDRLEKMDDVDIDRIIMTNEFGLEFDITQFITTIGFYESIFSPFIVGEMVLEDMRDLMTNLAIVGREKILVRFKTPVVDDEVREITLCVVGQKSKIQPNKSRGYIVNLRLVSENYFVNQRVKKSISFTGRPHEIVEKVVNEYLPGSLVENEESVNDEYKIAYCFKQPHQMISQVSTMTSPKNSKSPEHDTGYLFYETVDGLNFRCFNNMFLQEPVYNFYNSQTLRGSQTEDEFLTSTFYPDKVVFKDTSNRVKQLENGSFASQTYFHDLTTKQWGQSIFNYSQENRIQEKNDEMFPIVSENQPENYDIQKVFFTPRHTNIQGENFRQNENHYETTKYANSNLSLYNETEVELTLSGNSLLRAGQTVNFQIQKNEPDSKMQTSASDYNEEKSGRYLISGLHHRFFLVTGTHKTYATLIRNFRGKQVPQTQQRVETT